MKVFIVTDMINVDEKFKEVANADFDIDSQNMRTTVASITTREIQQIDSPFNDLFMKVDIPSAYRVDARSFIERPFFVDAVIFPNTAARYTLLTSVVKFLPGDVARSNASVLNLFKMAAYGRPDLVINVSMAGTITHAGCVLVGVLPPLPGYPTLVNANNKKLINTILSGPHAFLHANEATSVAIPVPWYCNTDMATTDMDGTAGYDTTLDITVTNGDYATLVYLVLNPLAPSTGSTTSLRIIVEACFRNFDLVVPTPRYVTWSAQSGVFGGMLGLGTSLLDSTASGLKKVAADAIDAGRGLVKQYTGLHNPNVPQIQERIVITRTNFVNNTDCPQFFEKLDPYVKFNRIVKEPIFGSDVDEMAISNITAKKQFIGTFSVSVNDNVGAMKWARPISPFQGGSGVNGGAAGVECYNNLELLHAMSRGWRGGLKIVIQSVMNNKQQCKLKVIKMYNPSIKVTNSYPVYSSIVNAPAHLLEFTEGGQEHEVQLPYLCRNDITPCASNMDTEALFHGMYYVYVAQPLVISDSSPNNVEFNMFLVGDNDLTFYGYTTAITYHNSYGVLTTPTRSVKQLEEKFEPQSGTIRVMNEPQKQSHVTREEDKAHCLQHMTRLMPTLDIRPFIRRMYKSQVSQALIEQDQTYNVVLPLSSFLGENPANWNYTPIETFSRMYFGKTIGFKFRCMVSLFRITPDRNISNIDQLNFRVYYVPQSINALTASKVITTASPNTNAFTSPNAPSDGIPLPYQIVGQESTTTQAVYEFAVPDTSFYKFMGGPNKFYNFDSNNAATNVSQGDFGSIVLQYTNLSSALTAYASSELFVGLSDETRFGYHAMAPPFVIYKTSGTYLGSNTSAFDTPATALNPFVYRGGFL